MTADRAAKTFLNDQFSRIGKALASPRRIELLDLLAQGERSVESIASETQMSVALASAHLKALRGARLVEPRREGTRVFYRLAGDDVYRLLAAVRDVARTRLAEVEQAVTAYLSAPDDLEPLSREELAARVRAGEITVLDVRPADEYAAGHIPGALSIPIDELEVRLAELPPDREIVAYCRGPYCLYAPTAVGILHQNGLRARRLIDGFPEWRLAGLRVSTGMKA